MQIVKVQIGKFATVSTTNVPLECFGNVNSMIDFSNKLYANCYSYMFKQLNIITAPELPAIELASNCYEGMFKGCTSLTTAPELPAKTLAASCYAHMFKGCTSLSSAPELKAEILAESCCVSMFEECTSLIEAPKLPVKTLADGCYQNMFKDCENLISAPELPATNLTYYCYYNMFYGCSNLNYVKVGFTAWHSNATSMWLSNVAQYGTFVCPSALDTTISHDINTIPKYWDVEKY